MKLNQTFRHFILLSAISLAVAAGTNAARAAGLTVKSTVTINGSGTVSPTDKGRSLNIGTNYTIQATAAADAQWLTSVPEAMAQAKKENKLVLLDFTGSDWCGWCKKLAAETFSKSEFISYASKNLVLVEVDFPAQKQQSAELKAANQALQAKYHVNGYPTLVVLKPDGTVVWTQDGYLAGGPAAMIAKLDDAKKK
jgi:thiol:disulfide interchange protein